MMQCACIEYKGHRLLPAALDYVGKTTPKRIYASILAAHDVADGFRNVTTEQVLHAVDALAAWIVSKYGRSDCFETLAYVGLSDLRYAVFFFAAVKCGHKVLFFSPRNTIQQNISLLQQTECTRIFFAPELGSVVQRLQKADESHHRHAEPIAPFFDWVAAYQTPFSYTKTFEEAKDDPVIVLHSSGSTGAPKPITQTHQFFANLDRQLPPIEGREIGGPALFDYSGGGFYFSPFPCYHLAGFQAQCFYPVFGRSCSLVMGKPGGPATAELTLKIMERHPLRILHSPPSIIESLSRIPEALPLLRKLEHIIYAGGPLERGCGDLLVQSTKLSTIYGSTETGNVASLVSNSDDWQHLEFHPSWKPTLEATDDGSFEMVVNRDAEADQYRAIGGTILKTQEQYRSRDLFVSPPTKPGLWRFAGRRDDIMVLSNGEKWNPVPSEAMLLGYRGASGVLAVGNGRFQPAVLVEIEEGNGSVEEHLDAIWPLVEKANQNTQAHGRLVRSNIKFVKPGDLVRSPKGTVIRAATAEKLHELIDQIYSDDCVPSPKKHVDVCDDFSRDSILSLVRDCFAQLKTFGSIGENDDLFLNGLDSLNSIEIARSIKKELAASFKLDALSHINHQLIFENPNISDLADRVYRTLSATIYPEHKAETVSSMIRRYSPIVEARPSRNGGLRIVLTGSTGSLGRQLLRAFVRSSSVLEITCLDRNPAAELIARQNLSSMLGFEKAKFKTCDIERPYLGLTEPELGLFEGTDAVLHCAWNVNFIHGLASFEPQIRAIADFCSILTGSSKKPRFFFVSSTAAVMNYRRPGTEQTVIPEDIVHDDSAPLPMGYGQSKYVAEHILGSAAHKQDLRVTILRLGQVAGNVNDDTDEHEQKLESSATWNTTEWIPSLIATSSALGQIPDDLASANWIPADKVATIILEIVLKELVSDLKLQVYNIINPQVAEWMSLVPAIQVGLPAACRTGPFQNWLALVKQHDVENTANLRKYPSLKMIKFLEYLEARLDKMIFATDRAQAASLTLANMKPISADNMSQWMKQWAFR